MSKARRIVITGFMAAGKTTVARALARLLGDAVIDLDASITKRTGRTPYELISEAGEAAFRELETRALREALQQGTARVIALGGGAWLSEHNRTLVAQHDCVTVWLDAPFDLCWQRISASADERPLAPDEAAARARYEERRAYYQLAAHHINVSAAATADDIAADILESLEQARETSQRR
jgi:shikimate kinase